METKRCDGCDVLLGDVYYKTYDSAGGLPRFWCENCRFKFEDDKKVECTSTLSTRPSYYPSVAGVESIRVMEQFNFNLGNAMKYIWRTGKKPGETPTNDLRKARQYLDFEIDRLEREGSRK